MVIIGIDPHKATHTAVAVDDNENVLAELEVRAAVIVSATTWYFVLFFASDGSAYSGLLERVLMEVGTVWIAVVAVWMVLSAIRSNDRDAQELTA